MFIAGEARTFIAKARVAISGKDAAEAAKAATLIAISALDKAAQKGVVHKNNAARRKSRLMKSLAAAEITKSISTSNQAGGLPSRFCIPAVENLRVI